MSIFRRDAEPNPIAKSMPIPSPQPPPSSQPQHAAAGVATHIASGTKVVGQITGEAELVIDGHVEGEINLDSRVVVGSSGSVKGTIQARAIEVGGKVQGNVRGRERVEVLASGGLEGDVVSPRVVIAEGAFFKGKVEMTDPNRRENKPAAPHQKPAASSSAAKPNQGGGGVPPAFAKNAS